eukprot:6184718-Pleurochrysis_carterae.AAC.2
MLSLSSHLRLAPSPSRSPSHPSPPSPYQTGRHASVTSARSPVEPTATHDSRPGHTQAPSRAVVVAAGTWRDVPAADAATRRHVAGRTLAGAKRARAL